MAARGRQSAAELAVAPFVQPIAQKLPEPPSYLTPEQEEVWRMVISSRGGDLIAPEAFPVLVEYCRQAVIANQIAAQLDAFDPEWAKEDDGLKRWDKLHQMQDRALKALASLGGKLRLTPASRVHRESAGRNAAKGAKRKPWESDDD